MLVGFWVCVGYVLACVVFALGSAGICLILFGYVLACDASALVCFGRCLICV